VLFTFNCRHEIMNACYLKSLDDAATHDTGGCARLEVEMVFGESTATTAWASNPLNLLTPCSRGKSVWAVTSSFGGGLVAGDQTRLAARIGPVYPIMIPIVSRTPGDVARAQLRAW
jgi:hypothetical protein